MKESLFINSEGQSSAALLGLEMAQLGGGDLAELLCFLLLASNKICEN